MTVSLPLARTIILTDAGTVAYTPELAAYDGTAAAAPTPATTAASSGLPVTAVVGLPAIFVALYARLTAIATRATALRARRRALATRIAALEP